LFSPLLPSSLSLCWLFWDFFFVLPGLLGSARAFLVVFSAFALLAFSLWVILGFFLCFARPAWFCEGFFSCFLRFCPACFLFVGYSGIFSLFCPACSVLRGLF